MTNKERVINAIKNKSVDRVPVSFSIHFPKNDAFGEEAVNAHLKFYKETGVDILKVMNENLLPQIPYHGISSWKDFPVFSVKDKFIQDELDLVKKIMDRSEDGTFFLATLHGLCASMIHPFEPQIGYEKVRSEHLECFRKEKDAYLDAAKKTTDAMIILIQELKKIGVDGVYYAALGAEKRYFSDDEFAEAIAPFDKTMLQAIKDEGMYSFLHMCKDALNMKRYESYAEYADVVNWGIYEDNNFSLEDGRAMFPGNTIMGGLANRKGVLVDGSNEELEKEVKKIVTHFGKEKFIFAADCTLPTEIPYSRLKNIVRYVSEV